MNVKAKLRATRESRKTRKPFTDSLMRGQRGFQCLALIGALGSAALGVYMARVLQLVLDVAAQKNLSALWQPVLATAIFLTLSLAADMLSRWARPLYARRAMQQYKTYVFGRIAQKSIRAFSRENTGTYVSALTNDAAVIERDYVLGALELFEQVVSLLGSLLLMLLYSWRMTLMVIPLSLVPLALTMCMGKRLAEAETMVSAKNEGFVAAVKDLLSGFSVVKSFRAEKEVGEVFAKESDSLEAVKCRRARRVDSIGILAGYAAFGVQIGTFFIGAIIAVRGEVTPGVLIAFLQLTGMLVLPLRQIPQLMSARRAACALMDKLNGLLAQSAETTGTLRPAETMPAIRLRDVSFAYETDAEPALRNVNVMFESGKRYALVGASGSGKSTLLSLLLGAHGNYEGSIEVGGCEMRDIDPQALYDLVSVIEQDVFVFDSTLEENVTLFKRFEQERVRAALEGASLSALIEARGADFRCGENGSALSGGERQRVSIARCLLRGTPVLLADEATAALDAETAHEVIDTLLSAENATRIVVTHRLDEGIMRRYDEILVLRGGSVVERGSFDALMQARGYFYSLQAVSAA